MKHTSREYVSMGHTGMKHTGGKHTRIFHTVYARLYACVLLIAFSVLSAAASCKFESGGFTLLTGDYSTPYLNDFRLNGTKSALMTFSKPVDFSHLTCTRVGEDDKTVEVSVMPCEGEKASYILTFFEEVPVGNSYLLEGVVKDAGGSSLRFSLDFYGYNSRVPAAVFSEISPAHAASKDPKKAKAEFIELYILEDGNLGGMVIQSGFDGVLSDFILPAAEVRSGDYVSVHMRILGENAVSETGDNLALSATACSCPVSRDIWNEKADSTKSRLGSDDVILLRNRSGGEIIDAILYSRSDKPSWAKPLMTEYAADAVECGIWVEGELPENAVCADNVTAVKTLSRLNIGTLQTAFNAGEKPPFKVQASDWKVLSGKKGEKASPGRANVFSDGT